MPDELIDQSEIEEILKKLENEITVDAFVPDIINTKIVLTKK